MPESSTGLRFGLGFFTAQVPLDGSVSVADELASTVELATIADDVGFDSVWMSEHHGASDAYLPSILPVLAAIATRTTRVKIGAATLLAPFHHPLRLAEDAAVVDQLSRGRLILGLGLGWRPEEFRAFGIAQRERVGRTTELIEVLRRAWTGDRFSFDGTYFRYRDVLVTPRPFHPIPIWMGGAAPAAIRRAARIADGFVASQADAERIRARIALANETRRARHLELSAIVSVWLGPVTPAVLRGTWHAVNGYAVWRSAGDTPEVAFALPPPGESLPSAVIASADPPGLIGALRPFAELARNQEVTLIVRLHYPGVPLETTAAAVRAFGTEVIPALCRAAE